MTRDGAFERDVVAVLRNLEPGEVATYGEVAEEAGYAGAARAVGNLLARREGLPWWRVVRADGSLLASHVEEQTRLLHREGVRVRGGRVDSTKRPARARR